ncbi:MAG: LEA type 2 family protein [Desulfuromonadales bacterium]|nr:LEA type 2 family protein [Desulfuromonadales bacterium]
MIRNSPSLRLLIALLLGTVLTGCAAIRPEPPDVQLAGLTISDLSLSHANFLATLSVFNPNNSTLDIEGLEFALSLDEVQIARGATAKAFSIPAEQTGETSLRLSASLLSLFRLTHKLKGLNEVPFRIAGQIKVGGPGFLWMTVPINSEGSIPLVGTFDQFLSTPDDFWRQPDRLLPEETPGPDTTKPPGR